MRDLQTFNIIVRSVRTSQWRSGRAIGAKCRPVPKVGGKVEFSAHQNPEKAAVAPIAPVAPAEARQIGFLPTCKKKGKLAVKTFRSML